MKCLAIISIAFVHDMRIQKVAFIIAKRRQLSYTIQQSMKFSQKQLHDKIRLVEWEAKYPIKRFNLLTIHSLLIDQHPKFIFLKNIVQQYNVQKHPERARSRQPWIERLFQMLSQLIRIPIYQNILHQLEKIYLWATKDPQGSQPSIGDNIDNKVRPTTASTKVRSHSAYSRKTVLRPTSAYMQTIQIQKGGKNIQPLQMNKMNPKVDYSKLKRGQQEFYAGIRSLHSEYEHPKKRLKEYQRKVFYEQQDDSDIEIIEIAQKAPIYDKQLNQQIQQPQIEEVEQLENQQDKDQAQDPNIQIQDNIPFDAQQQVQAAQQQLQQVVDRLKPNVKPYADSKLSDKVGKKYISSAYQQIKMKLQQKVRQAYQDEHLAQLQVKWAQSKGRSKTEVKRRAQSARMLTKIIGVPTENREQLQDQAQNKNLINFQNIQPAQVNKKELRPSTAFTTTNHKNTIYNIKQAIISGNLNRHIHAIEEHNTIESTGFKKIGDRYTIHAEAPKRKDFEEIMKQAQQRVRIQAQNDVHLIKQTLAKNKISLGVNKIAKSISYFENQFINSTSGEDGLKVGITGMGMMKNPFIKIAKKKKKKTKK